MLTEHEEQAVVVEYLTIKKIPHYAVPNGSFLAGDKMRRIKQMARLKKEGLKNGVPDLVVLLPTKALYIEMKRIKGSTTSQDQKRWHELLNSLPYCEAVICKGAKEALEFIKDRAEE
jgi:hypothetical protein